MTRRERMRRVALLCIHFARNLSFYRAGMDDGKLIRDNPFWKVVNFNFFDQSILEWCKLFADNRGEHYWEKIIRDKEQFETGLLDTLSIDREGLDGYSNEMRRCRDKFIAHLDSENEDDRPIMDKALESAIYYYNYILVNENEENNYPDFPKDLRTLYEECEQLALSEYAT